MKGVSFLLFALFFISLDRGVNKNEIFEGKIIYSVNVTMKEEGHPHEFYHKAKHGDFMEVYIAKDGSQKRIYKGSGQYGLDWSIYRPEENIYYSKWHFMDSIFYYDCSEVISELQGITEGKKENILGDDCNSIIVESLDRKNDNKIKQWFYYSGKERVRNGVYSNFKDGYLNKVYEMSQSHIMKWVFDQNLIRTTFEAISIEQMDVDRSMFDIPEDIEKVKM